MTAEAVGAVVEIAGVPVALCGRDRRRGQLLRAVLAGAQGVEAEPVAIVTVDDRVVAAPSVPPRDELFETRLWYDGRRITAALRDAVLTAAAERVTVHLPTAEPWLLEAIVPLGLAWVLAGRERFVVHGGAVACADGACLVLGHSGAGKSTLVAAAMEHGWTPLSDDLVVLVRGPRGPRVFGLHRRPAIPAEIGGSVVAMGYDVADARGRVELPVDVLSPAGADVVATVIVTHARDAGGSLAPVGARAAVPLLLQSFPATIDPVHRASYFSYLELLHRLPVWELGHAADVDRRRDHVGRSLATISAESARAGTRR